MDFKGHLASAVALNVTLKLLTFTLTTLLTRQLAPNESGINFSCQLYFNTVLFLARDCVRSVNARKNLRERAEDGKLVLQVMNCASASLPLGIAVMVTLELLPLCGIRVFPSLVALPRVGDVAAAVGLPELLLALSVVVSLTVEPCVALVLAFDYARIIVTSEFWALLSRLVACLLFLRARGGLGGDLYNARLCFANGYLTYATATAVYFFWLWNRRSCRGRKEHEAAKNEDLLQKARRGAIAARWGAARPAAASPVSFSLWLRASLPWCFLSWRAAWAEATRETLLLRQFLRESCLRLLLSEGEHFALAAVASATVMGEYDLVSSLGAIFARLIFRVWENACFVKWSRDAAKGKGEEAISLLVTMLRVASYFGAAVVLLAPPLAEGLLLGLFSRRWASPVMVRVLQLYCYLLPLLAWYGLLDAFVRATASASTLRLTQRVMVAQAAMYAIACYVVLRLRWVVDDPATGLIAVNIAAMALRCASGLCLLLVGPGEGPPRLRLCDLKAVVPRRIALAWAVLFAYTRWAPWGPATALTAAPLFAWALLRWDPELRRGALNALRR
ncbi:putative dolichyl-P-Man:GDP-Man5GlcNAc2-PP-dolichyl alpha-1,2-mannosyltranslocase [Trypanosoma conorhini]|uniref:Protein RFT1 homolog n=1 Tax=Trypanosoma conorhini TaxID=83891 RepID=A0A422PI79_9TRYP|nr:putative dolichyl-P-Man:GDP-Man5GlcNAc2-PP-dolichyl alpha-1,2-mannosyltranslocase [Trypanosoma conorhini]RNF17438.1 putative dolichyl-P-Man:GDP-Man5GlcNAc2-PP-dolichyl alpha-1,2-mannosyltranslocase [Trypanosoma conorhini]